MYKVTASNAVKSELEPNSHEGVWGAVPKEPVRAVVRENICTFAPRLAKQILQHSK